MFWFGVPWLVVRGVLAGMKEEPRTCCAARFGLCDAEAGANDAGEDGNDLQHCTAHDNLLAKA